ncbi:MAG: SIS domain-containing protein [Verrucomicrobia bacterium]|nr:SIS domain-containing protein [Verrucomicrobiota bacterium]MDA1067925.1 SIS domain-containing protein [Verrucomicrobiota bacterium]
MRSEACEAYLNIADQFKLGSLDTEKTHPLTQKLSKEAKEDLSLAIENLKRVDIEALSRLESYLPAIAKLGADIKETLVEGGKIYLCGCGATGRLSIALEIFCREGLSSIDNKNRFIGFMAGGDVALIKSIENFEDRPEYGKRQLKELGFKNGDLLIGSTEGGETPFVIGATEAASEISERRPWFLYCNPDTQLKRFVERSRRILEDPKIQSQCLAVGPMGLSGSTRMQASTVLMASIGWAIETGGDAVLLSKRYRRFYDTWNAIDLEGLDKITEAEADTYKKGDYVIYRTREYGVTVLTDTTERSPTFSLPPFENEQQAVDTTGWCYLTVPDTGNVQQAWEHVLKRPPRCLEWEGISSFTGYNYILGFYIDGSCLQKRLENNKGSNQYLFDVDANKDQLELSFRGYKWSVNIKHLPFFDQNLILKQVLNIHSTLIMGRLDRFESNLMTYVRASNFKLIDRTIRYVQLLSEYRSKQTPTYEKVAEVLFELKDKLQQDEPAVLRILDSLK